MASPRNRPAPAATTAPAICAVPLPAQAAASLAVSGGLEGEQGGVAATCRRQLAVRASLCDLPIVQHQDQVGRGHHVQPVRNQQAQTAGPQRAEALLQGVLDLDVEARARLVEDEHVGAGAQEGPSQRDPLPFAAGQRGAAPASVGREDPAEQGLVAAGRDGTAAQAPPETADDPRYRQRSTEFLPPGSPTRRATRSL
jgi:hypothetical protein